MKLLYITAFVPYPATRGGRLRVSNLMRILGDKCELHGLSLDQESDSKISRPFPFEKYLASYQTREHILRRRCAASRAFLLRKPYESCLADNMLMRKAVAERLKKLQPDAILVSRLSMLQYVPADWLGRTVLDQHDLSRRLWRIMLRNEKSRLLRLWQRRNLEAVSRYEERLYPKLAGFASVSEEERQETCKMIRDAIPGIVVPNGVDTERYKPDDGSIIEPESVILLGAMDQRRNIDAARFLVEEIMPHVWERHPQCTVWIVGRSPVSGVLELGRAANVNVTGEVVDERPYLHKAGVAVAPFRMGSGVKHKVPIALAMGKALVATTNAVHGVPVVDGEHCIVVDDNRGFAAAILRFIEDVDTNRRFGRAARDFAERKLTWQVSAAPLLSFLAGLISSDSDVGVEYTGLNR